VLPLGLLFCFPVQDQLPFPPLQSYTQVPEAVYTVVYGLCSSNVIVMQRPSRSISHIQRSSAAQDRVFRSREVEPRDVLGSSGQGQSIESGPNLVHELVYGRLGERHVELYVFLSGEVFPWQSEKAQYIPLWCGNTQVTRPSRRQDSS